MQDMTLILKKIHICCDLETFDLSYGSVQEGNLQKVMVGHETNFFYFTL